MTGLADTIYSFNCFWLLFRCYIRLEMKGVTPVPEIERIRNRSVNPLKRQYLVRIGPKT
jgi:hypothetical protein